MYSMFLSFRLGRQPMINNVVGGLFDGVNAGLAKNRFQIQCLLRR